MQDQPSDVSMAVLEQRVGQIEQAGKDLSKVIDRIRERLPNWAVWVMMAGAGLMGFMVQWLINCVK